jgi:hypothetical protein
MTKAEVMIFYDLAGKGSKQIKGNLTVSHHVMTRK